MNMFEVYGISMAEFEVGEIEYNGSPHILKASLCLDENGKNRAELTASITIYTTKGKQVEYFTTNCDIFGDKKFFSGLDLLKSLYDSSDNNDMKNFIKWWEIYSYNGELWAGTREQMSLIKNSGVKDYYDMVAYLKERNMFEVEHNGEKVRYGEQWWYPKIPDIEVKNIKDFIYNKISS